MPVPVPRARTGMDPTAEPGATGRHRQQLSCWDQSKSRRMQVTRRNRRRLAVRCREHPIGASNTPPDRLLRSPYHSVAVKRPSSARNAGHSRPGASLSRSLSPNSVRRQTHPVRGSSEAPPAITAQGSPPHIQHSDSDPQAPSKPDDRLITDRRRASHATLHPRMATANCEIILVAKLIEASVRKSIAS